MHAIVHIGAPKAGSTSIQQAMRLNRTALERQGIHPYIPATGQMGRALSARFRSDRKRLLPDMRLRFESTKQMQAWSARCWEELAQEVRHERPNVTLLSSEHFVNLPHPEMFIDELRTIFSDITVIAYIRDPVAQYASQIDQWIRGGARLQHLKTPLEFRYYGQMQLGEYLGLLDRDHIVVRNFDQANLAEGDVVHDFFRQLGGILARPVALDEVPPRANESMCGAVSAWLLTVNETFDQHGTGDANTIRLRRELFKRLRRDATLAALPRLKLTDADLVALIRHNAREKCIWFNETFLDGQPPFDIAPAPMHIPDNAELRTRMRSWILGYLTPEHLELVLAAVVPDADPGPVPQQRASLSWQP